MNRLRTAALVLSPLVLLVAALAQPAGAQTYPAQNITFQVAFAASGIADVVARLVANKLTERLGHTIVVENRGGAGGNLAAKAVSGAAADGHTILATTTSLAVNETACAVFSRNFEYPLVLKSAEIQAEARVAVLARTSSCYRVG